MSNETIDNFWLDDYKILYENNNYIKFVPLASMTKVEQLNAITRFSVYAFILLLLFGRNDKWLYFPLFLIILCIVLFKIHYQHLLEIKEKIEKEKKRKSTYRIIDVNKDKNNDNYLIQNQDADDLYEIEQNQLNFNDPNPSLNKKNKKIKIEEQYDAYDKNIINEKKRTCVEPTRDNPYMNFLLSDYLDEPNRPAACSSTIEEEDERDKINRDMTDKFNFNLYRDTNDLFEKMNSQRQFYTTPATTNPNRQGDFAEWLYKIPETCKTEQVNCLRYEDLRYKRL